MEQTETILPNWVLKKLPEPRICDTIGYDEDREKYWKKDDCDNTEFHSSLSEAYRDCNSSSLYKNVKFDESLAKIHSLSGSKCAVFDSLTGKVLQAKPDDERMREFEQVWSKFTNNAKLVKDGGSEWRAAMRVIEYHPFFWLSLETAPTFSWVVDDGLSHVSIYLSDDDKNVVMSVIHDSEVIETQASTLEAAYCNLAKALIDKIDEY